MARPTETLDSSYFDRIYAQADDPWGFETRAYEREKYERTLASLPRAHYRRGFEVGCSVGVLSSLLLTRCDALVSTEINTRALARARAQYGHHAGAEFLLMNFPVEIPSGTFDLVVLSEVAYYWAEASFTLAQNLILEQLLEPGGTLTLVHYTPTETDYPKTGDEVHERYVLASAKPNPFLKHVEAFRAEQYRIDVFERLA